MIKIGLEAAMECEEQDCPHALHVDLCLLVTGGFGFKAQVGHGWQVLANPSAGPMAPFLTRCRFIPARAGKPAASWRW